MSDEDIEEFAYQAGHFFLIKFGTASASMDWLRKFADKVAAAEREACAKVCEQAGIDGYGTLAAAAMIRVRREQ
jgi:2-hydroxychromene-2-carboxylate isomerase